MKSLFTASFVLVCIALSAQEYCEDPDTSSFLDVFIEQLITEIPKDGETPLKDAFVSHLDELIDPSIIYDGSYRAVEWPCGDAPAEIGVCADVVVRAFLKVDICLQRDIRLHRRVNGLPVDPNIDHRRVRNIGPYLVDMGFKIKHKGEHTKLLKGDIIWFKMPGNLDHIAIAMEDGVQHGQPPKVLHNIGYGQVVDRQPWTYEVYEIYRINK